MRQSVFTFSRFPFLFPALSCGRSSSDRSCLQRTYRDTFNKPGQLISDEGGADPHTLTHEKLDICLGWLKRQQEASAVASKIQAFL